MADERCDPGPLVIVGDSYATGVGASSPCVAYPALLARHLGIPVKVVAAGGCGFLARGPAYGPFHPLGTHRRRRWRVPRRRRALLLQGSGNDRFASGAELRDAMERYLGGVRGESPVALTGAIWAGNLRELLPTVAGAAAAVAAAPGHAYLDVADWFGESPDVSLLAADGGHPSDAGHARIAERLAEALRVLRW